MSYCKINMNYTSPTGQQSILGSMLEFDFPLFDSVVKGNCFIFRFKFQKLKMPVMYGMQHMKEGDLMALSVVLLIFLFCVWALATILWINGCHLGS